MEAGKFIFSADGFLHLLPFEALMINSNQFLGEEKQISYSYSLLQYINQLSESKQQLPVTVFTFPQNHLNFPALPNSTTEAGLIQKKFSSTIANAAETNSNDFLKAIQQPSVLHIATHAVADDSFNQPYFVLQNKLYLGQLQYIKTASPLVVLTACETAAGNLQTGEGVASLARVLISKGVKGVVASRWKVDDAVAPVFVKEFYTQLKEKQSPSAALFAARKQYLQSAENLSAKDPMLWAGFTYMGVEQEVELKKKSSWLNYIGLITLLLIVIFIVLKTSSRKKAVHG
jgi:CHAT domain-containing protein